MKRESRAPLIVAIVLLLLPVLYVGSYLALVTPCVRIVLNPRIMEGGSIHVYENYRVDGSIPPLLFWPLEQIDRKVRPGAWDPAENWYRTRQRAPVLSP